MSVYRYELESFDLFRIDQDKLVEVHVGSCLFEKRDKIENGFGKICRFFSIGMGKKDEMELFLSHLFERGIAQVFP